MKIITSLQDLDLNANYTYADYLLWKFNERVELIKGKILKMSPAPNLVHQRVNQRLIKQFFNYFDTKPCQLFIAPFDVRLVKKSNKNEDITTVVQPDLCVICDENKLDEKGCIGVPDLVIEILSPGNSKKELNIKFNLYEENEVLEYWLVEPYEKAIFIYTLQNGKYIGLKPQTEDEIIQSPLFPNLHFNISDIFIDK